LEGFGELEKERKKERKKEGTLVFFEPLLNSVSTSFSLLFFFSINLVPSYDA